MKIIIKTMETPEENPPYIDEYLLRIKEVPQLSSFTEVFGLYVPFETHISHRRVSL